ncbi:mesoderm induction early response protein 1 isoform X2 [Pseudomyrmex gracilis]|uniref:mesoderm induction early response protein 1 isoform X2 n=1 Tax=Pseudomyrmex gracilis TaxID=219809 RepID=UPI000995C06B|nr:mesoderm induction early response protein 1 isoform X2 [Pseudomyrmex gracilis]
MTRRPREIWADRDYDMGPATEMIINDFDDERTLDEEEALEGSEDSHNELSNLQKEGDMPLKELLAMYGYGDPSTENSNSSDHMLLPSGSGDPETEEHYSDKGDNDADDDDDDDEADASNEPDLKQFYTEMLVQGKDKTTSLSGSTTKSNSGTGGRDNRKRKIHDDEDDDEEAETEECVQSGSAKKKSPASGSVNACGDIANLGETNIPDSTVEESSSAIDGSEDRIVSAGGGSSRLLRSVSRPQSEEEEDDCDYSPDEEDWKKTIMVGTDYQAAIPEGLCRYDDALPYENEDKMLWDPSPISEEDTEEFLERAQLPTVKGGSLPSGSHVRDDEQALYLLLQCGYNHEEALRRRRMNVLPPTDAVSLWSEEECHNFESGLRTYGKDFHLIHKNKVRTRSVGELVQFYYLWKKTERHDIFTYKARLEKKKYALHPGITDYMDRFLEEQEGVRDRSSSPNVHCLLYGDTKRQRSSASVTNNDEIKSETWDGNAVDPLADANGPTAAPPPPPPPPPPPLTTTTSSSMCNSSALTTSTYCSSSTRHTDCSSSESGYMNSTWSGLVSRSQPTSSVITTITINTTTATATSAAMITGLGSTNTVSTSSTAATAAATASNNYYHQRVTSSRSNDSHDTPSPENILPHLPP